MSWTIFALGVTLQRNTPTGCINSFNLKISWAISLSQKKQSTLIYDDKNFSAMKEILPLRTGAQMSQNQDDCQSNSNEESDSS